MTPSDLRRTDSGEKNSVVRRRGSLDGANPKAHSLVERLPSFVHFGERPSVHGAPGRGSNRRRIARMACNKPHSPCCLSMRLS